MLDKPQDYYQYSSADDSIDAVECTSNDNELSPTNTKWYYKKGNWFRLLTLLLLITLLIIAIIYNQITLNILTEFLKWMKNNLFYGTLAYIFIFIICTVLMIPGTILTLGAGFVYADIFNKTWQGIVISTCVVWVSASIGATLSFINGRYLLRDWVTSYTYSKYPKFELIDKVVQIYGFKVTFLLRLTYLTPYNVFNYFMGLTSVTLRDYVFAHLGMIPDVIVGCFVGASLAEITKLSTNAIKDDPTIVIVLVSTGVVSVVGIVVISYFAKKEFDKMAWEVKMREASQGGMIAATTQCDDEMDDFDFDKNDDDSDQDQIMINNKEKNEEKNELGTLSFGKYTNYTELV